MNKLSLIIDSLHNNISEKKRASMKRVGINLDRALGVSISSLRIIAKEIPKNKNLSQELWQTNIHEAQILASYIYPFSDIDETIAEQWVQSFDSWDLCDQIINIVAKKTFAWQKADEWANNREEFIRRAGFVTFCNLAVHDKKAPDEEFTNQCFPLIIKYADDERNFVKKAVNWLLRNIGKRNSNLNKKAVELAQYLLTVDNKTAEWIAKDALTELTSPKILQRLESRNE